MADQFNLDGLHPLFSEALERNETTLIFEIRNGNGKFLFLMFFDHDDIKSQDQLFIYLKNTKVLMPVKLYGNHRGGQFFIYIDFDQEIKIRNELGINKGNIKDPFNPFILDEFLKDLNLSFPQTLPLQVIVDNFKSNLDVIKENPDLSNKLIDETDKTVLIGIVRLPKNKTPRMKTLRKLYLYTDADPNDIDNLIGHLKRANITLAWTVPNSKNKPKNVQDLIDNMRLRF